MSNWKNWLLGSARDRELAETRELFAQVRERQRASIFGDRLPGFIVQIIADATEERGVLPGVPLGGALYGTIQDLLVTEAILMDVEETPAFENYTMEEGVAARQALRQHLRFLEDHERLIPIWREKLVWLFRGMLEYFPPSVFADYPDAGAAPEDDSVILPEVRAFDLCENLPELIERCMVTFYDDDVVNAHLFDIVRERFENNIFVASGIPRDQRHRAEGRMVLPTKHKPGSRGHLVDLYLQGTPLQTFLHSPLPFSIPFPARFEHTHIVGGTGHGKTQLLQFLINHDLVRSMEDGRSVVIMDSQGDLIRTISHVKYFDPTNEESRLADRFVLIDPNDVEHPVCLNMFDFNRERLSGYTPLDREKILNATIELYEYFFGALLGAELTQRQGVIFKYLARLMVEIPDATIHTLRDLMEDGERFRPYIQKLSGTARSFFETRFFDRSFNETKKQVLTRLWGVLANATIERMFSHARNKVDIFELINSGKIILINTAKDLLGQEGTAIFGRFFIAMIAQAAVQRAALPAYDRRPTFFYIDEAHDYFDSNISNLLTQARKYRIGLVFAHQHLDQLGSELRASVLSSTSIKFAGGVSAKDAALLDAELRCQSDFLLSQKKNAAHTEFGCYIKNYTANAISVRIPLGYVDELPAIDAAAYKQLLAANRERYTAPPEVPEFVPRTQRTDTRAAPESELRTAREEREAADEQHAPVTLQRVARETRPREIDRAQVSPRTQREALPRNAKAASAAAQAGRGGQQHKYLQHLIKQLAEERGFLASIEEQILNGAGSIDVSLSRENLRIACEISVTTNRDQELGNIEKCIAAGYTRILLVGSSERHLKTLAKFIEANLDESHRGKVEFAVPEKLIDFLESLGPPVQSSGQTVRGYKVRTVHQPLDPHEADARRRAIAEVIARSVTKQSKSGT